MNVRYHDYGETGSRLRAIVDRRVDLLAQILAGEPGEKTLFVDLHYDLRDDAIHAHLILDLGAESLRADARARDRAVALTSAFATLCRAARARAGQPVAA
ncbi:MAG: hypothetical protein V9F06_11680 [Thermomicrobiales bacterium]